MAKSSYIAIAKWVALVRGVLEEHLGMESFLSLTVNDVTQWTVMTCIATVLPYAGDMAYVSR